MQINGKYVALDLETKDPLLKEKGPGWAFNNGYPVGYAISWFKGDDLEKVKKEDMQKPEFRNQFDSVYLGIRHEAGGNVSEDRIRSILGPILSDPSRVVVAANIGYDYGWTLWDGFKWLAGLDDIQIQAPLIDDNRRSVKLDLLAQELLGVHKKEEALIERAKRYGIDEKNVKSELWKMTAQDVAEYAEEDAVHALRIHAIQQFDMKALGLERVHELERRLIPVTYAMRKHGVRVDLERAEQLKEIFFKKQTEFSDHLTHLVGKEVDPWDKVQHIELLKAEGVEEFPKTEKKGDESLDQFFLKTLEKGGGRAGEIATDILGMRRYQRARKTFIEEMILGHNFNGRIHCELHALRGDDGGTVSGRFSSSKPNLQQVPARDPELGPLIRGCFLPDEGEVWMSIDYSSQEPRLAVHFGEKANIRGAAVIGETYRADPRADAYMQTAELCGIKRSDAKIIKLGILYGMGGGKLAVSLGLPHFNKDWIDRDTGQIKTSVRAGPEAEELLAQFDRNAPMDRRLAQLAQAAAKNRGYVKTILGRRATFPRRVINGVDRGVWFTHKALNRIIQGSAADMMKQAMVNLHEGQQIGDSPLSNSWKMLITVHDEIAFSVDSSKAKEVGEELAYRMSTALELTVPVVCDVEVGNTWGESMGNKL